LSLRDSKTIGQIDGPIPWRLSGLTVAVNCNGAAA
jgi:hypothetical protein